MKEEYDTKTCICSPTWQQPKNEGISAMGSAASPPSLNRRHSTPLRTAIMALV